MEPSGNIAYVCADCKAEEIRQFQENIVDEINEIEKRAKREEAVYIKTGFDILDRPDEQEHMWVKVLSVDRSERVVRGHLDNMPVNNVGYQHMDEVEIPFNRIANALWNGRDLRMLNHQLLH